jgi:hypothetical protein
MKNGNSDCAKTKMVTGDGEFVWKNLANRLFSAGESVASFENLSRTGVEQNHKWPQRRHGDLTRLEMADLCNMAPLLLALEQAHNFRGTSFRYWRIPRVFIRRLLSPNLPPF